MPRPQPGAAPDGAIVPRVHVTAAGAGVAATPSARRRQIGERIRRRLENSLPRDAPLGARVRELSVIQDEQGYLCETLLEPDGTIRLIEHNCAIYYVASGTGAARQAEVELFREVLDADVVRETHIASGDRSCSYR